MENKCFSCMNVIPPNEEPSGVFVRVGFCHPSYWHPTITKYYNTSTREVRAPYRYGKLEKNGEFGTLYLHRKCDASSEYNNSLGEGYMECDSCNATFNDDEFSVNIYEITGDVYCSECAAEYVKDNIKDFISYKMPNFNKRLSATNLDDASLEGVKGLRVAPEDSQGWSASIWVPDGDRGKGTYQEAIEAIVGRGNGWLIITGGPGVTHNICATAVTVYEYNPRGFEEPLVV
jgi:hypothetical protein